MPNNNSNKKSIIIQLLGGLIIFIGGWTLIKSFLAGIWGRISWLDMIIGLVLITAGYIILKKFD